MKKKLLTVVVFTVVAAMLMTACRLPASQAPEATATPAGASGLLDDLETPQAVSLSGTQTAAAAQPTSNATQQAATVLAGAATTQPTAAAPTVMGVQATQSNVGGGIGSNPPQPMTATPLPPVPQPTPGRPATYTLQQGEWPICIARRFNLDLDSFFQVNGLNMQSMLPVGAVLNIPATGTWSSTYGPRALKPHPAQHVVQAGWSIYDIACYYGDVDPNMIAQYNGLSGVYTLTPGQVLNIP